MINALEGEGRVGYIQEEKHVDCEFWKHLYEREWEQRQILEASLGIPVGATTVLGGGLYYMVDNYSYSGSILSFVFTGFIAAAYLSLVFSIVFIIKAIHGYEYSKIPTAKTMSDQMENLINYYSVSEDEKGSPKADFESELKLMYIEAADDNAWNNIRRSTYIHKSKQSLILLLVFAGIAAPLSVFRIGAIQPEQAIEIKESQIEERIAYEARFAETGTKEAGANENSQNSRSADTEKKIEN